MPPKTAVTFDSNLFFLYISNNDYDRVIRRIICTVMVYQIVRVQSFQVRHPAYNRPPVRMVIKAVAIACSLNKSLRVTSS